MELAENFPKSPETSRKELSFIRWELSEWEPPSFTPVPGLSRPRHSHQPK